MAQSLQVLASTRTESFHLSKSNDIGLPLYKHSATNSKGTPPEVPQSAQLEADNYDTDVLPSSSPRFLHDLHGRPPWLPFYPCPDVITIPLPRGTPKQHPFQPSHEVVCHQILGIHGCRIWCASLDCEHCFGFVLTLMQEPHSASRSGRQSRRNRGAYSKARN